MKTEIRNMKLETNRKLEIRSSKRYDLEDRCLKFAKDVRSFVAKLPYDAASREDTKQLIRSSGSVGANYLEANESLSKKDFQMRLKIAKKEARESIWWLELLQTPTALQIEHARLSQEATELMNILGAIMRSSR